MKVNIEIDDDSKFFQALSEEIKKHQAVKAGDQGAETHEFALPRANPLALSCVAISCNGGTV
jgi:hypothetical protein